MLIIWSVNCIMSENNVQSYDRLEIIVYFIQYKEYLANEFRRILGDLRNYDFILGVNEKLKEFNVKIIPKEYALIKYVPVQEDNSMSSANRNVEKKGKAQGRAKGAVEIYDAIGVNSSNKQKVKETIEGVVEKYNSFKKQSLFLEIQVSEVL